jgi:hypothetical protein
MPQVMKILFLILSIFVISFLPSNGQRKIDRRERLETDTIASDSLVRELIIIDPGFDSWLITQPPMDFYSKDYYRQWNIRYVTEWNRRYMSGRNRGMYESYIDYDPNFDYGLVINYRLFNYFRYFEETNHVRLVRSRR